MKRLSYITLIALVLASCTKVEDTRIFMPQASFEVSNKQVVAENGAFTVKILLSRAAQVPFTIGVNFLGDAVEGTLFIVSSHSMQVAAGDQSAELKVSLLNDNIWEEESSLRIVLAPGKDYTVDPAGNCEVDVTIHKDIVLPFIGIRVAAEDSLTNPYLADTLNFTLFSSSEMRDETQLEISAGSDFKIGEDYLINEGTDPMVTFRAGSTTAAFRMEILKKDISGFDKTISVAPVQDMKKFLPDADSASISVRIYDPTVEFSNMWRTAAALGGTGFQQRQAIKAKDGTWSGNRVADLNVSSAGSNYLRSYRNMFASSWNCQANTPDGDIFRLTEFVPALMYPRDSVIADYGIANNTKFFSPCDSIFRFVADEGSKTAGRIFLDSPRTFTAFIALRSQWDGEDESGSKRWQVDSRATGGDVFKSSSPLIIGRIDVTLVRLEGTFDISDYTQPMLLTAWFKSDSPVFMREVDFSTLDVRQETDGTWRVQYKFYPR
jgi:hypothetical protein